MHKKHIYTQTGLRGIAALAVIPAHFGLSHLFPELWPFIENFFPSGTAVNVFFVLSGFILCYVYHNFNEHPNRLISTTWRNFFVSRFVRIVPLYYVLTLIGYFVSLFLSVGGAGQSIPKDVVKTVIQLLFLHPFPGIEINGWIGPSWSLAMEVFAYVVIFPLLTLLGFSQIRNLSLLIAIAFLLVALNILGSNYLESHGFLRGYRDWPAVLRIIVFFPLGMVFHQLTVANNSIARNLSSKADIAFLLIMSWHIFDNFIYLEWDLYSRWGWVLSVLFVLEDGPTVVSRFLSMKGIVWLGKVSYSIYLVHFLFGLPVIAYAEQIRNQPQGVRCAIVFLQLACTLGVSAILYRFVEVGGKHFLLRCFDADKRK